MMFLKLFVYFLFFAFIGVAHEVLWTGILDSKKNKDPRLKGRSSLWMFPVYGGILFIIILVQWLYPSYHWAIRGTIYMTLILAWEFITGTLINRIAKAPWNYAKHTEDGIGSPKRFNIKGLICLEYAPIWFVEGLLAEWLFLFLENHVLF